MYVYLNVCGYRCDSHTLGPKGNEISGVIPGTTGMVLSPFVGGGGGGGGSTKKN